jgi:hypothetical protein
VRLVSSLEDGATNDWRTALGRLAADAGGVLAEDEEPDVILLLSENNAGLPDEKALALPGSGGRARFLTASPSAGSELYTLALAERICLRGNFALAPHAVTIFEGMSAAEALADQAAAGRIKDILSI